MVRATGDNGREVPFTVCLAHRGNETKSVLLERCEGVCLWRDPESSVLLEWKYSPLFAVDASPKAPGASLLVSTSSNQKER